MSPPQERKRGCTRVAMVGAPAGLCRESIPLEAPAEQVQHHRADDWTKDTRGGKKSQRKGVGRAGQWKENRACRGPWFCRPTAESRAPLLTARGALCCEPHEACDGSLHGSWRSLLVDVFLNGLPEDAT